MAVDIEVDYEVLEDAAAKFRHQADEIYHLLAQLQRRIDTLQTDGWLGTAARAFYVEMDYDVLPAVRRLAAALDEAFVVSQRVSETFELAEEDAAAQVQVLAS